MNAEPEIIDVDDEPSMELDRRPAAVSVRQELTVDQVLERVSKVRELQTRVMKAGVHYGVVPGVDKPGLSKAGAETLLLTFWLAPKYRVTRTWDAEHLTVEVICELYHRGNGDFYGEGVGLCSTRETKYAYRKAQRTCPACGTAAIIKGKAEYGGGWLCWAKKDGCGTKFSDGDPAIESQETGRVENEELADTYNTVLKMAKKRALVDAVLTATAAGDVFTQDVEEGHVDEAAATGERPAGGGITDAQLEEIKQFLARFQELKMKPPSAFKSWQDWAQAWCVSKYEKDSLRDLTEEQADGLIEAFRKEDPPFG